VGDGLAYLIIGFATAFNILVIKFKIERKRYADGIFDAICLILLAGVFAGTLGGLIIGTIASAVISVSLFFSPPKFTNEWLNIVKDKINELKA
jgi:hypothetical protein